MERLAEIERPCCEAWSHQESKSQCDLSLNEHPVEKIGKLILADHTSAILNSRSSDGVF